jgi:histidinol-phosphate phosphatase family protein
LTSSAPSRKKAVFLDRDGTLIVDKIYLNDPEQIEYLPGVFLALQELAAEGFVFVVVTNQSGVARGLVTLENLHEIHRRMTVEFAKHGIEFADFYYAPYSVESNHALRKPNPGMLLEAAEKHSLDLGKSWMVGDRASDVEAGHRAGCRSVLLTGIESAETIARVNPQFVAEDIPAMCRFILGN